MLMCHRFLLPLFCLLDSLSALPQARVLVKTCGCGRSIARWRASPLGGPLWPAGRPVLQTRTTVRSAYPVVHQALRPVTLGHSSTYNAEALHTTCIRTTSRHEPISTVQHEFARGAICQRRPSSRLPSMAGLKPNISYLVVSETGSTRPVLGVHADPAALLQTSESMTRHRPPTFAAQALRDRLLLAAWASACCRCAGDAAGERSREVDQVLRGMHRHATPPQAGEPRCAPPPSPPPKQHA